MQNLTLQSKLPALDDSLSIGDDLLAEADEPPDLQQLTPRPSAAKPAPLDAAFGKTRPAPSSRKESLLTQALHSESDSQSDDDIHQSMGFKRGFSTVSTWSTASAASTAELTSDGGFTSPGTRTSSPSPPLPPIIHNLPPIAIQKDGEHKLTIRHEEHHENVTPQKPKEINETSVEQGLGRRRCITFACAQKKETTAVIQPPKPQEEKPAEPAPRKCMIKFACDAKATTTTTTTTTATPKKPRMASPPPPSKRLPVPAKTSPRSHRGSDSTVRNESPKHVRKIPSSIRHSRKYSENSDIGRREATRFHEFASSEEEVEEWTQELTCHKSRLTVGDTLKVENGLRKLAEEVEEEVLEDEDDEDDEDLDDEEDEDEDLDDEDDEDDEDGDEDDDRASVVSDSEISDGGFQTDDEQGFAGSDDESDAGSDYQWWAPGRASAVTSAVQPEHIRPGAGHRSMSDSSTGSLGSGSDFLGRPKHGTPKKRRGVNIRPRSPELPDSTDFVCGTLDEDRPLEEAYISALSQRRAAKHKITPQDIDPTFPTSDPELEEEDEDDDQDAKDEDSDQHMLMHGQLEQIDEVDGRGRRRPGPKRSPVPSPKRLRSPPPTKRLRSPPPRKAFGQSPRRLRSPPPPVARLKSPPVTRTTSFAAQTKQQRANIQFAQGPQPTHTASLPRRPNLLFTQAAMLRDDGDDYESGVDMVKRGPMDIKAGTALKRQRRREKLYQKHCRKAGKKEERRPAPGKGAQRMRQMGIDLAAYRGKKAEPVHVFSY
ncbi:uncharacterized protein K452DRAFT_227412 [Aplosporella prunicola CBS 121167]|uniref:Extensin domain-containing protein n=1 Tax=Aplosporella prunicola CBS 121167 TaxID=1176127 RepID=A0A6A6BF29_9PEZI|nr:uncharacterized protein K452DRAFT_227412 [Aplosporella prunicola CBS 121167]KAF2141983.1 hypothetical protein K452DRAFT_227412 [Aplosporella prunicola CBS 121167]